jgi:hypothetical protein
LLLRAALADALAMAAAAMGAPFWFDALNRLVNLRNTGKIPESKA